MYPTCPLEIDMSYRTDRRICDVGSSILVTRDAAFKKGKFVVFLRLPRTFSYSVGHKQDMRVPVISQFQWNPFTTASSPQKNDMQFASSSTVTRARDVKAAQREQQRQR